MLDDGERLVPGFRQARALRVWAGVRAAVPGRAKAERGRHARRQPRPRGASTTARATASTGFLTITGGKLTTFRLMAAGHRRRDVRAARRGPAVPHGRRGAARHRGRRALRARLPAGARARTPARRAAHLRVRADRGARRLEEVDAPARHDEPRRHPPQPAAGHGPVPGRLLHLPGDRASCTASSELDGEQATRLAARLPAGALEGRVADPLRRPAAPGAPGRLDLPGPARRGAPAARRCRAHEPSRRRRRRRRPRRARPRRVRLPRRARG